MSEDKLTGQRRYRSWKGKLVLQVQYEYLNTVCLGGFVDSERCRDWRDATVEDITHNPELVKP